MSAMTDQDLDWREWHMALGLPMITRFSGFVELLTYVGLSFDGAIMAFDRVEQEYCR